MTRVAKAGGVVKVHVVRVARVVSVAKVVSWWGWTK